MNRWTVITGCVGAALLCGLAFWAVTDATVVPMVARGTGPGGVQVTSGGWLALLLSALGTGGFTLAGLITAIANRLGLHVPVDSADTLISEVVELTASFTSLMNNRSSRAAQRRFFFALVDAARLINGCETSPSSNGNPFPTRKRANHSEPNAIANPADPRPGRNARLRRV